MVEMVRMRLTFVVNGQEVALGFHEAVPLDSLIEEALSMSQNASRPREDWELRHENGVTIACTTKLVSAYGFAEGAHLFLTLRVGVGG